MRSKIFIWSLLLNAVAIANQALAESTLEFAYSGRLVESSGKPVEGPVALKVTFFRDAAGRSEILSVTDGLQTIALQQGIFQFRLSLSVSDYDRVFSAPDQQVWIQITDLTHPQKGPFPLQQIMMTPYAAKVPVDGSTVSFNGEGKLTVGPQAVPSANQFLTKDAGGNLIWATPATSASALQGQSISTTAPTTGQILQYNGTQWLPMTFASGAGTAAQVQTALGYTPVNKAGDSMTGSLNMGAHTLTGLATPTAATDAVTKSYADGTFVLKDGSTPLSASWSVGQDLTNVGNIGIAAAKTLNLGTYGTDPTGLASSDKGKIWFNSATNQLKYWDGSLAQALGVSGAGLTNLGGQSGSTQTFAVTTTGNAPAMTSASNVHTLNLPFASAAGTVTAGLLSNADFVVFNGKQAAGNYITALTGDLSAAGPGSSAATLAATGVTAGAYPKVTVDVKGRVTAGTSLVAADLPVHSAALITSGTFGIARGGTGLASTPTNGQLLVGNGTDYTLATLTSGTGVNIVNTAGGIIVNATDDAALKVNKSGDTMSGPLVLPANGLSVGSNQLVAANGNIGIGTATPSAAFDIVGPSGAANMNLRDANGSLRFATNLGTNYLQSSNGLQNAPADLLFTDFANAHTWMTLKASGNLGIGTTVPGALLDIAGAQIWRGMTAPAVSAAGQGLIYFDSSVNKFKVSENTGSFGYLVGTNGNANFGGNSVAAATAIIGTGDGSASTASGTLRGANGFGTNIAGGNVVIAAGDGTGNGASGSIQFQTAPAGTSGTSPGTLATALSIVPNGNVGVGTTAPAGLFDVNGKLTVLANGNVGIGTTTPGSKLHVVDAGSSTTASTVAYFGSGTAVTDANVYGITIDKSGSGSLILGVNKNSLTGSVPPEGNFITTWGSSQTMSLGRGGNNNLPSTADIFISGTGNVGIGTTAPGASLDISGAQIWRGLAAAPSVSAAGQGLIYFDSTAGKFKISESTGAFGSLVTTTGNASFGTNSVSAASTIIGTGDGTASTAAGTLRGASGLGTNVTGGNVVIAAGDGTGNGSSGSIQFQTAPAGTSGTSPGTLATALAIVPNGNVGVGTTTPAGLFDVNGKLTVLANGNVGIGTTAPVSLLSVVQPASTAWADTFNITGPNLTAGNTIAYRLGQSLTQGNAVEQGFQYAGNNSANNMFIYAFKGNGEKMHITNGSVFKFGPNLEGSSEWMRLTSGNLGIGTTAPVAALDAENATLPGLFLNTTSNSLDNNTLPVLNLSRTGLVGTTYSSTAQFSVGRYLAGNNASTQLDIGLRVTSESVPTKVMTLLSSGNVGISTTTPNAPLHVSGSKMILGSGENGTPGSAVFRGPSAFGTDIPGGSLSFQASNGTGSGGSGSLIFQTSATGSSGTVANTVQTRMTIAPAGNVGIGTTTPAGLFDVNGKVTVLANGNIGIGTNVPAALIDIGGGSGTAALSGLRIATGDVNGSSFPVWINANTTGQTFGTNTNGRMLRLNDNRSGAGYYDMGIDGNASFFIMNKSSVTEGFVLNANGNVGIGTTTPSSPLQVVGTGSSTTMTGLASFDSGASTTAGNLYGISVSKNGTDNISIGVNKSTVTGSVPANSDFISTYNSTTGISFGRGNGAGLPNTSDLYVSGSGNIGIGTTSPTALLQVNGDIVTTPYAGTAAAVRSSAFISNNVGSLSQFSASDWGFFGSGSPSGAMQFVSSGTARAILLGNGNFGIGTTAPSNTLHVVGSLCVKGVAGNCLGATAGTIYATATTISAADLAEHMPVVDDSLEPGDIVVTEAARTDEGMAFAKSTQARQANAAGVISTSPGVALGSDTAASKPVALAGRVPVNVTMEGGAVAVGDYLVSSSTPGKAMRAKGPTDAGIIGVALSAYDGTPVKAKEWTDGIAHEVGHQVMMLVHLGAGSQVAVGQLKTRADKAEARTAKVEDDAARLQLRADIAKDETERLKAEISLLKALVCTQLPASSYCHK